MSTGFVKARDGLRIAYEVHGHGSPPLVFVHGWSCDRSYWRNQIGAFASDFTVVTLDLAGHGESARGREAWTIEGFGGDVAALVQELGLSKPILIGHSMGGDVVGAAALQLPERVGGLVWVEVYRQVGTPRTAGQRREFWAPFHADFGNATREFVTKMFPPNADRALVKEVAEGMAAAPPEIALPSLEAAFSYDSQIPGALRRLGLKVIAINSAEPPTDVASMERFGISTRTIPGVGHFPMLEAPGAFNALLKTAIVRLRENREAREPLG